MSNPVFIVGTDQKKIVIRFFMSKCADFEMENKVFDIASSKGYAPRMIESDNSTYRVEEYYEGSPYKHFQLSEPSVY